MRREAADAPLVRPEGEVRVGVRPDPPIGTGYFRAVFEHAPSAMLLVDADASLSFVNARVERVFGFSRDELLGRMADLLAPPDQREELRRALLSPLGPLPAPLAHTVAGRRKDGRRLVLEIEPRLIEADGASIILASVADVTERSIDEAKVRAAMREKSLLVSEVHHRVKNNLQVICSLLELQKARVDDPELVGILSDSHARVVSMALVHQAICQAPDVARVDFRRFLETLVARLHGMHGDVAGRPSLELDAVDLSLTMERAMPCGLAANELLSSALRRSLHSGAGLEVSLSTPSGATGCLSLRYLAPPGPCPSRDENELGRRLIDLLVAQARGRLQVDDRSGELWRFTFPIHARPGG